MDYDALAYELLRNMRALRNAGPQKQFREGIHGETLVLFCIRDMGDHAVPGRISVAAGITSARVAAALNGLEGKGLITRETDAGDRRRVLIRLTPKGADEVRDREKRLHGVMKAILTRLGDQDAKEYVRITHRLAEVMANVTSVK